MKKTIIISGASGMVGTGLLDMLKGSKKFRILALYHHHRPVVRHKNIIFLKGELTGTPVWNRLKKIKPYAFLHCAAYIPGSIGTREDHKAKRINLSIDTKVLQYAILKGLKLIYISSSSVYGMITDAVCREESRLKPLGAYADGKVETEYKIKHEVRCSSHFIFRISAPYGRHQHHHTVLRIFVQNALKNRPLLYHGSGKRMQDFTHVKDIARACIQALKSRAYGVYNISSGNSISMKRLAFLIKKITNSLSIISPSGKDDIQESYRPRFNITKAKSRLGWVPTYPLAKGLKEYIQELKK